MIIMIKEEKYSFTSTFFNLFLKRIKQIINKDKGNTKESNYLKTEATSNSKYILKTFLEDINKNNYE